MLTDGREAKLMQHTFENVIKQHGEDPNDTTIFRTTARTQSHVRLHDRASYSQKIDLALMDEAAMKQNPRKCSPLDHIITEDSYSDLLKREVLRTNF